MNISERLNLWLKLTGVDLENNKKSFNEWHTQQSYEELLESIELDKTGVITNLIIEYYLDEYLDKKHYSLLEIINDDNKEFENKIKLAKTLKASLLESEIIKLKNDYITYIKKALKHYNVNYNNEEYSELLKNKYILAILRRDAYKSFKNLKKFQFYAGKQEKPNYKPQYSCSIYKWFNINSLIQSASLIPSGISLHLIQSPDKYQSYFLFCLKNGENIILYTDKEENTHPLQGEMTRRPDRKFAERVGKNWFPYELFEYEFSDDMKNIYFSETKNTNLTVKQNEFIIVSDLKNIEARSLIWIITMFELIIEKDWTLQLPELAYTNEMIINNELILLNKPNKNELIKSKYKKLELSKLTIDDVLNATETELGVMDSDKIIFWLVERYKNEVNEYLLNKMEFNKNFLLINNEQKEVTSYEYSNISILGRDIRTRIKQLDPTYFGSKENIEKDRIFIARYNLAAAISHLAEIEYEERIYSLKKWYEEALIKNKANIIKLLYKKEINSIQKKNDRYIKKLMKIVKTEDYYGFYNNYGYIVKNNFKSCFFTEVKTSHHALFNVFSTDDLMLITGINDINLIPDVFRNIYDEDNKSHEGNHLLNRIDPMLWNLRDPFNKFNFKFQINLSKRIYNKIMKGQDIYENY